MIDKYTAARLLIGSCILLLLGGMSLAIAAGIEGDGEPPETWYYVLTVNAGEVQTILHVATVSDKDTEGRRSTSLSQTPEGLPKLEAVIILLPFDAGSYDLGESPVQGLNSLMAEHGDALAYFRARSRMSGEDFELGLPSHLPNTNGELVPIGSAVLTSTLTQEMTVVGPSGIRQWNPVTRAACAQWVEDCGGAGWEAKDVPVMKAG